MKPIHNDACTLAGHVIECTAPPRPPWPSIGRVLAACLAAACIGAANANVPRVGEWSRPSLQQLGLATPAARTEPSSRHEPAMLDKLDGAELANRRSGHERNTQLAGVTVLSVRFGSAMWRNGLRPADVIVAVDWRKVGSLEELTHALARVAWPFTLVIVRDGRRILIVVP